MFESLVALSDVCQFIASFVCAVFIISSHGFCRVLQSDFSYFVAGVIATPNLQIFTWILSALAPNPQRACLRRTAGNAYAKDMTTLSSPRRKLPLPGQPKSESAVPGTRAALGRCLKGSKHVQRQYRRSFKRPARPRIPLSRTGYRPCPLIHTPSHRDALPSLPGGPRLGPQAHRTVIHALAGPSTASIRQHPGVIPPPSAPPLPGNR